MKIIRRLGCIIGITVITVSIIGCSKKEPVVQETLIEKKDTKVLDVEGNVQVKKSEEIYSDLPIVIDEILVEEGQVVHKGDALFTFNNTEYTSQIETYKSQIKIKEIALEKLKQNVTPTVIEINNLEKEVVNKKKEMNHNLDIQLLEEELAYAKHQLALEEEKYAANEEIYEAGGIAEEVLRGIKENIVAKQNDISALHTKIEKIKCENNQEVQALQDKITAKQQEVTTTDQATKLDMETLEVEIKMLQQNIADLQQKMEKKNIQKNTFIVTADQMIIDKIYCNKGTRIQGNQSVIMTVQNLEDIRVALNIPIEDVNSIAIGDTVNIYPYNQQEDGHKIFGNITSISAKVNEKDKDMITAYVAIKEGAEALIVGSDVNAAVEMSKGGK